MDEARKLDIAQIAASEYARKNAESETYDVFGKQVAQVFKDAYEALGDKAEPKKYYNNSDQAAILSAMRRASYASSCPTFADYAKVTTGYLTKDTSAAWKDLEAAKVVKYNEKVRESEEKIAKHLSSDGPSWTETPTKNGVYFTDSMQSRLVLVLGGTVHWFGILATSTVKDSGISRFYGPMKAPE